MIVAFPKPDRDRAIEKYYPLVAEIATAIARGLPPCFDVEDLIGYGVIGMIGAIDSFDASRLGDAPEPLEAWVRFKARCAIKDSVRRRKYEESTRVSLDEPLGRTARARTQSEARTLRHLYDNGGFRQNNRNPAATENEKVVDIDTARQRMILREVIAELPERQRRLMEICYLQGRELNEAGAELNSGAASVRATRLHYDALTRVAEGLRARGIAVADARALSKHAPYRRKAA